MLQNPSPPKLLPSPSMLVRRLLDLVRGAFGLPVLFIFASSLTCLASAQSSVSNEELHLLAEEAFLDQNWEEAHRRLAELLSLEGTNEFLQMRYAATLLHDARMREEGIQRLATLDQNDALRAEGRFWWGKAQMMSGKAKEAEEALTMALEEAEKQAHWRSECELALRQARQLPSGFPVVQNLFKVDAMEVPVESFHRYIHWGRSGARVMLAPEELSSKLDLKRGVVSPVSYWQGASELFYHSYGGKGKEGLDLWMATLNEAGEVVEKFRLPESMNSSDDDMNPVWDQESQCLYFASNRPGTVGGMDLYMSCRHGHDWSEPSALGPMYNSTHDDLAMFPGGEEGKTWLLTTREGPYSRAELWEVQMDGDPVHPVLLTTAWEVTDDVVPGSLVLFDASTELRVAEMDVSEPLGSWELTMGSGQVLHYVYQTANGTTLEGTFAVPEVKSPSKAVQSMRLTSVDGHPFLETITTGQSMDADTDLQWGWNLVTHDVAIPTLKIRDPELPSEQVNDASATSSSRVVEFEEHPWWTDQQIEERAMAAAVLSSYELPLRRLLKEPIEFATSELYQDHCSLVFESLENQLVSSVLALAASEILVNEMAWEEALPMAMEVAIPSSFSDLLPREELERAVRKDWATMGALHDKVVDNQKEVGAPETKGRRVLKAFAEGEILVVTDQMEMAQPNNPRTLELVWALAQQPDLLQTSSEAGLSPRMWDMASLRREVEMIDQALSGVKNSTEGLDQEEEGRILVERASALMKEVDARINLIEGLVNQELLDSEIWRSELRAWKSISVKLSQDLGVDESLARKNDRTQDESETTEGVQTSAAQTERGIDSATLDEELKDEWSGIWKEVISEDVLSAVQDETESAAEWRLDFRTWLEREIEENWHPDQLIASMSTEWQKDARATEIVAPNQELGDARFVDAKRSLLLELEALSGTALESHEARILLESAWLMARWTYDPDWSARSPMELLAVSKEWHPLAAKRLKELRVQWVQSMTDTDGTKLTQNPLAPKMTDSVSSNVTELPSASASQQEEPVQLGAHGMHLGWFQNAPKVGALPEGTRLVPASGKRGMTRWVLVLPAVLTSDQMNELGRWLSQIGVPDAYEVFWHGNQWERFKVDPAALEPEAVHGTTEEPKTGSVNSTSGNDKVDEDSSANSGTGVVMENTVKHEAQWGEDDLWEHGAPVELGKLMGTWYAVQVGAFSGIPDKAWIELAGERLVYEPFPDGLARWYAGVRQDQSSARLRCDEMKTNPLFEDAFVVRLRDGVREIIHAENVDLALGSGGTILGDVQSSGLEQNPKQPNQGSDASSQTDEESGSTFNGEVRATIPSPNSKNGLGSLTSWHIDIAKYYGTVPSKDVASLLFKAADWGVRSVELFGQTTYYSRTFTDLAEAERILREIRSEGFDHAQIIKETP